MPAWMIKFYWFCIVFLIAVCGWLIFDFNSHKDPHRLDNVTTKSFLIKEK